MNHGLISYSQCLIQGNCHIRQVSSMSKQPLGAHCALLGREHRAHVENAKAPTEEAECSSVEG